MESIGKGIDVIEAAFDELVAHALLKGAEIALWVSSDQIVVDERVSWKCRFGCPGYGYFKVCPPHSISTGEFTRNLIKYSKILLVRTAPDRINDVIVDVERKALKYGYHLALGLKGGPCTLCEECAPRDEPCANPKDARPSMEGLGVDVFATLAKVGIDESLKSRDGDYRFYGLILVC